MLVPIWALIIAGLVVVLLSYATINLLLKNEKYEDLVSDYRSFYAALNQMVIESDKKIREADQKGLFESDDEVGSIFKVLKSVNDSITNFFKVEQTNGETQERPPK